MIHSPLLIACLAILALSAITAAADVDALPVQKDMPNPLIMNDGSRVTTPQQWTLRREEMKRIIERYLTGRMPPAPGNMKGEELKSRLVADGAVRFQRIRLRFGNQNELSFDAAIFTPAKGDGPFPVIVQPVFFRTPGDPVPTMPTHPTTRDARFREMITRMADPEGAAKAYADALGRGYAVMTFHYQQLGADRHDYRDSGFFTAYPDYDWADLAAWAWGMSRCVDWLEQQPWCDKTKLIALGHSRLGKATLVAGAFDERFALVAPAGSGCAGTGAFRFNGKDRGGKEGLENVAAACPQWISPNLAQFSGNVEKLPFDQHWLIALVAPRAFIAADALDDAACNGNALKQSYLAAKPIYEFLGVPDRLGIHFRPGTHALADEDWKAILDFADRELRGKKTDRRFDEFPPAELLR